MREEANLRCARVSSLLPDQLSRPSMPRFASMPRALAHTTASRPPRSSTCRQLFRDPSVADVHSGLSETAWHAAVCTAKPLDALLRCFATYVRNTTDTLFTSRMQVQLASLPVHKTSVLLQALRTSQSPSMYDSPMPVSWRAMTFRKNAALNSRTVAASRGLPRHSSPASTAGLDRS